MGKSKRTLAFLSCGLALSCIGLSSGIKQSHAIMALATGATLWVGETEVTAEVTSGEGWSYDEASNTLTLNDYRYSGYGYQFADDKRAGLYYVGQQPLYVVANGRNHFYVNDEYDSGSYSFIERSIGAYAEGGIHFSGDGSLQFTGSLWGVHADATVDGCEVTVSASKFENNGRPAFTSLTVNSGKVKAAGGSAYSDNTHGGVAIENLVLNGGIVTAEGGNGHNSSDCLGVSAITNLTMNGGTLYATGGTTAWVGDRKPAVSGILTVAPSIKAYGGESDHDFPNIPLTQNDGTYDERHNVMFFESPSRQMDVPYKQRSFVDGKVVSEDKTMNCKTMTKDVSLAWSGNYYIEYNLTLGAADSHLDITLEGDVNIILADNITFRVYGSIKGNHALNFFGGEGALAKSKAMPTDGAGAFEVRNEGYDDANECVTIDVKSMTVYGGNLYLSGERHSKESENDFAVRLEGELKLYAGSIYATASYATDAVGVICESATIYGGYFSADGGDGTSDGADAVVGNVTMYGGSVYLRAGSGNDEGNGGNAMTGNLVIYDGSARLYGGYGLGNGTGGNGIKGNVSVYGGGAYICAGGVDTLFPAIEGLVSIGEGVSYRDDNGNAVEGPVDNIQAFDYCTARIVTGNPYIAWNHDEGGYKVSYQFDNVWNMSPYGSDMYDEWLLVAENLTFDEPINVGTDVVNLLLADGVTLTANQGIVISEGKTLNIYAQSLDNPGKLIVKAPDSSSAISGLGTLNIYSGNIVLAGSADHAAIEEGVNVYGGSLTAIGGENANAILGTLLVADHMKVYCGDSEQTKELRDPYDDSRTPFMLISDHAHHYDSEWCSDENSHWHACTDPDCPEPKADVASHAYGADIKDESYYICSVCAHEDEIRKAEYENAKAIREAEAKITAIGTVEYNDESKAKIDEARAAYDALSDEQKAAIGNLQTLLDAENAYAALAKNAGSVVNLAWLIVLLSLLVACAGGLLYFMIKEYLKAKESMKDTKAMSVSAFALLGVASAIVPAGQVVAIVILASLLIALLGGSGVLYYLTKKMKKSAQAPLVEEAPAEEKKQEEEEKPEEEETVTLTDDKGNVFQIRFVKSFTAKLIQAPEETKKYYEELKNEVLAYKKAHSRVSWHFDSVNAGRNPILKFAIRGKTLCVYLPLVADAFADTKYKLEKIDSKRFEDVPSLYRIKNLRRLGYAKELIALVCEKIGLVKGPLPQVSYVLPYEGNKPLIERGLIKELKIRIGEPVKEAAPTEEEEEVIVKDDKGNIFRIRYERSFTAKMKQGSDELKAYYRELKNHALSYKKVNSRISWGFDSVNLGREKILKFAVRGKTLCVYLALDADQLEPKYKVEKVESKKYEEVPCLYRIKNDRRLGYCKQLIDMIMGNIGAVKGEERNDDYPFPYETTEALVQQGLIKERRLPAEAPVQEESPEAPAVEEEEEVIVKDDKGNIFRIRYDKSFTAKMKQGSDELKAYYRGLKNHVLSYKKANSRISWGFDSVNLGREKILKFAVRGKTLCVYLALDADKLEPKYKVEKVESKKYEEVPCLYRIKNDRRYNYAKQLIDMIMGNIGAVKGEPRDDDYPFPYETTEALVEKGLIKERKMPMSSVSFLQGFKIQFERSFTAKMCQAPDELKAYYRALKNHVLSYKKANSRISWGFDSVNLGREKILKFAVRGKTLCVYLNLDADQLEPKYKVEKIETKKHADTPCLYRIKNDRRLGYAMNLIDMIMGRIEAVKGEKKNDDYPFPYETTEALIAKGLIKERK